MFIVGYFLKAAAMVMDVVLLFFMWVVIFRAILSWVNPDPYNAIVRFINNVTEPVLYPIRTKLPINFGGIDFSPIIVFLIVIFMRMAIFGSTPRSSPRLTQKVRVICFVSAHWILQIYRETIKAFLLSMNNP